MPQITLEYDKERVSIDEIKQVGIGIQKILAELTPDRLVFVNANSFDF